METTIKFEAHGFNEDDQFYYHALIKSFKDFIAEEQAGNMFAELRLVAKIEAARKLYK
jgi:hypothetical protein